GDVRLGECGAPVGEVGLGDLLAGAAPAAAGTVVLFEAGAQGAGRLLLQLGVDRGADGQAAGKELLLAEVAAELAADLVGEVAARWQRGAKTLDIVVLHR